MYTGARQIITCTLYNLYLLYHMRVHTYMQVLIRNVLLMRLLMKFDCKS